MDQYLDVNELSDRWKIKTGTIYSWISRKKIPYEKFNGLVRFNEAVVERWHKEAEDERKRRNYDQ